MKEETNLCRICLKILSTDIKHQMLKDLEENVLECLTEIDLTIPDNPLGCEECIASILSLYQFKQTCCATERLVQDLRSRSIPFEDALKYVDIDKVKLEEERLEVVDYNDIDFTVDFNTEIPKVFQNDNAVASYTCFTCSSVFNSRRGILRHVKIHKEKCTKSNSTLNGRKKVHLKLRLHKCNYCEYRFKTKRTLSVHLRKHTGKKPFACDLCEYKSARKDKYKLHCLTHLKERLFNCNDCNFGTNYKVNLTYHVSIHRRPFKCGQCTFSTGAKYLLNNHLEKHMSTHTNKNFKCVECDYAASTSKLLNSHMRTHTGERTYKCNKCSYSSVHSSSISRHRKLHLSRTVLKCNSCNFKTLNSYQLKNHKC